MTEVLELVNGKAIYLAPKAAGAVRWFAVRAAWRGEALRAEGLPRHGDAWGPELPALRAVMPEQNDLEEFAPGWFRVPVRYLGAEAA